MINNYLDYVKSQRKAALKATVQYRRQSCRDSTKWGQGFYAGHSQARYFEARHWRGLQKDIEARNRSNERIASIGILTNKIYNLLS